MPAGREDRRAAARSRPAPGPVPRRPRHRHLRRAPRQGRAHSRARRTGLRSPQPPPCSSARGERVMLRLCRRQRSARRGELGFRGIARARQPPRGPRPLRRGGLRPAAAPRSSCALRVRIASGCGLFAAVADRCQLLGEPRRSCSVRPSWARAASSAASATRRSARIAACRASNSASAASASRDTVSALVSSAAIRADCPSASPSRCSIAGRSCSSCSIARAASLFSASSRARSALSAASSRSSSASRRETVSGARARWRAGGRGRDPARAIPRRALRFADELLASSIVRGLRVGDRLVNALDLVGRRLGLRRRCLSRALGLHPACVEQPRFDAPYLVGQLAVALGRARLAPKLRRALLLVGQDLAQPGEIRFRRAKLLLGILAPRVKPGNARRFLQQQPPLDRLCGDDRADLALADQRRRVRAGRRIRKQQRHVLRAYVAAVDPVGRAGAALDPPRDLAFAAAAFARWRRAPGGSRLPRSRAAAGWRFRRRSRRPCRRREATSGWIRPSSSGSLPGGSTCRSRWARRLRSVPARSELGRLDEALEAAELEPPDPQPVSPPPRAAYPPTAFFSAGSSLSQVAVFSTIVPLMMKVGVPWKPGIASSRRSPSGRAG